MTVKVCRVSGCDGKLKGRGWCGKHYSRWLRHGDPLGGGPFRDGDGRTTCQGYIYIRISPDHPFFEMANRSARCHSVYEHRLVMAEHLGRPLKPHESVHHVNGNRQDNRIENLQLWSSMQPAGQRVDDKVEFATELLKLYAPDRLRDIDE